MQASISHFDNCEKYRVEKTLRSGNSETTELVYQIAADGSVSGPYIRKRFEDAELLNLYKRIQLAQSEGLREGGLPRVYETGQDESGSFAIIEYVKGENLRHAKPADSLAAFVEVCKVVQILHEKFDPPIIHRDIKPDNVIAVSDGVVLIDFGAARIYDSEKDHDTHPYATRAYAPPEQFGYAQTDRKSDIYSLGMLLAFLETGKDPDYSLKQAIRLGEDALIEKGISKPAASTIVRACAFDPSHRFNSISGMLDFLHAEIASESADLTKEQTDVDKKALFATASPSTPNAEDVVFIREGNPTISSKRTSALETSTNGFSEKLNEWRNKWNNGAFKIAGIVWDIILLVVWAFFMVVALYMSFGPYEEAEPLPVWLRFLEYVGVVMSLLTVCAAMLLDWRPVHSVKWLSGLKRRYIIAPLAAVFIVCLIVMRVIMA